MSLIEENGKKRCAWCAESAIYTAYHDDEWGKPLHDDLKLFEFLVLEGAQAGLSWITVLKRRDAYRAAFDHFAPETVAGYDDKKIETLLQNPGIIRNRAKIASAVRNARQFLEVRRAFGSFDAYIWGFTNGQVIDNRPRTFEEIPAETELSKKMSRDLKKRGFNFIGPTICYAFMQATGMVNDHLTGCWTREC